MCHVDLSLVNIPLIISTIVSGVVVLGIVVVILLLALLKWLRYVSYNYNYSRSIS